MPLSPPRACPCGGLIRDGKCSRCTKYKGKHERTSKQRGYGYDWQKFREYVLGIEPLCKDCEERGMVKAATELHHIRKIKDAPHLRLDQNNVRPLCDECHDARTARGE